MVRKQSHLHIQDHRNKNNRTIESRSIGTLAFAENYDRRHRDGRGQPQEHFMAGHAYNQKWTKQSTWKRLRSHLGVEPTRLIKIVRGRRYQPEEVHSKGARAPRPMEQRAGKQQRGENNKTTRADKRGKTGREQKNGTRRGDTHTQRHLSRVPHLHACEAQSRLHEKGPSGGPLRPMPLMRIGV
jgi:hypothetical protein